MSKGFGKPQPTKIDKFIKQAVNHAWRRNPEVLDRIFDNLPLELNDKIIKGTFKALNQDIAILNEL